MTTREGRGGAATPRGRAGSQGKLGGVIGRGLREEGRGEGVKGLIRK